MSSYSGEASITLTPGQAVRILVEMGEEDEVARWIRRDTYLAWPVRHILMPRANDPWQPRIVRIRACCRESALAKARRIIGGEMVCIARLP